MARGLARRLDKACSSPRCGAAYTTLTDRHGQHAFVHTVWSVTDVAGQRQRARPAYLAEALLTSIVWGDQDRIIPVAHAYQAAEAMGGARLEILEGAGHFLPWRNADWFLAVLEDFLKSTTPAHVPEAHWRSCSSARRPTTRRNSLLPRPRQLDQVEIAVDEAVVGRQLAEEDAERLGDAAGVRFDRTVELGLGQRADIAAEAGDPPLEHLARLVERRPGFRVDGRAWELRGMKLGGSPMGWKRVRLAEDRLRQPEVDQEDDMPQRLHRRPPAVDAPVAVVVRERRCRSIVRSRSAVAAAAASRAAPTPGTGRIGGGGGGKPLPDARVGPPCVSATSSPQRSGFARCLDRRSERKPTARASRSVATPRRRGAPGLRIVAGWHRPPPMTLRVRSQP